VKFHDGTDFDADVVVWNLEKILNDKSPQFDPKQAAQSRGRVPTLVGWKAVDKYTVELTTRVVNSLFPYDMSYIFFSSPTQWEKLGKDWVKYGLQPVGTGPFKVDRVVAARGGSSCRASPATGTRRACRSSTRCCCSRCRRRRRAPRRCWRARSTGSRYRPPDAIPRLKQGGMSIVTNKYPHNWAYQPSMVEGSPWTDIRVAQGGQPRDSIVPASRSCSAA